MHLREEITAFVGALDNAKDSWTATPATHISDSPKPLKESFRRAIQAVIDARYDHEALQQAADLIPAPERYPGGLGEMIQALLRVLIDNDAFDLP